jgi:hypothetical protein
MPRLVVHHEGQNSQVFELSGDRPVSIGRAKSSDLVLEDPAVSRVHGILRSNPDGRWEIIDRSNTNGVVINGRSTKEAILNSNDEIEMGNFTLRFEDSAERKIVSYGTATLPGSVAKLVNEYSGYSGSFYPMEPVAASPNSPEPKGKAEAASAKLDALEKENRLLRLLYRVNQELGQIQSVNELTRRILDLVLEIEGAERAFAMLLEDDAAAKADFAKGNYTFKPAVIRQRSETPVDQKNPPKLVISRTIIKQVMQSGLPMLVTDGQADPRFAASASIISAGIQSAMCAPLGIGKNVRGLLYADNLQKRGMFTVEHLNIFAVIAVQSGLAVDRLKPKHEPVPTH